MAASRESNTLTKYKSAVVRVIVNSKHLPEIKGPDNDDDFYFAYFIIIGNEGKTGVRLISRRWEITDSDNETRIIAGDGVIGQQPYIPPQREFSYTSHVNYKTPVGYMHGEYLMQADDGWQFQANIGLFRLSVPGIFSS